MRRRGNVVVSETARTRQPTCFLHARCTPPVKSVQGWKGVTCVVYSARLRPVNVTKGSDVGKFTGMDTLLSFSGHTERIPWLFAVSSLTHTDTKLNWMNFNIVQQTGVLTHKTCIHTHSRTQSDEKFSKQCHSSAPGTG